MHVVLAGGGTAGHVEPALATADALRRLQPDIGLSFLGTAEGLEARLVPARGYPLAQIPRVPLPRRPTADYLRLPGQLRTAVARAGAHLAETQADAVVGFGGYVAVPAYLAARRRRVPVVVHEANVRPGLANRLGARFADAVATAFPGTPLRAAVVVGMPLRREIAELDRGAERAPARSGFGLDPDTPTLLVFGGSQGAQRLNEAVVGAADALRDAGVQVLHAAGERNIDAVDAAVTDRAAGGPPYVALPYIERMADAYAAADLALCRAGAMTCAELTAVGLPAVYVPLPIGNGEQRLNAEPVVAAGGGRLVDNALLDSRWVRETIPALITDTPRLAAMARAAAAFGRPEADETLATLVLDVVARRER